MRPVNHALSTITGAVLAIALISSPSFAGKPVAHETVKPIDPANFVARVDNPYFPLVPGTQFVYHETKDGKTNINEVTVMAETKVILGVTCTVVHDVVKANGAIEEETYDWYAQDNAGNVWYFGEDTKEFLPKGVISTEGSWTAGVNNARPGFIMAGQPAPGAPYRQEYLKGHAEDMGQVVQLGDSVKVPFGALTGCVRTKEWSMLEAGTDLKWYAKGLGLVRAVSSAKEVLELVSVTQP